MKKNIDLSGLGIGIVSMICYYLPIILSSSKQAKLQEMHDEELKEEIMKEVEKRYFKKSE